MTWGVVRALGGYSHSKWGLRVYSLETLSAARRGELSPTSSFCQYRLCPEGRACFQHRRWGFVALVPQRCFAGRRPEKGSGRRRAADSQEAPGIGPLVEAAAGLYIPAPAGGLLPAFVCRYSLLCNEPRRRLPVCPVTLSHVCCCCLEVLFPWSPMVWGRKGGQE